MLVGCDEAGIAERPTWQGWVGGNEVNCDKVESAVNINWR